MDTHRTYLPGAGHDMFLPLYDPLTRLLGVDKARRRLLEQADLQPGHRILDLGCGTATLTVLVKQLHPNVEVVGLDPDPKALRRASRKAARAGVTIQLDRGFSDALPYPDGSFDRVLSSMMFHHLDSDQKEPTLREIRRVLKPGGRLEMLDFEKPETGSGGSFSKLFHSHHQLRESSEDRVLSLMSNAGFERPTKLGDATMLFGRVAFYQAQLVTAASG